MRSGETLREGAIRVLAAISWIRPLSTSRTHTKSCLVNCAIWTPVGGADVCFVYRARTRELYFARTSCSALESGLTDNASGLRRHASASFLSVVVTAPEESDEVAKR